MAGLTLVMAPADEPVGLSEAKLHLRVDHDDDDDLIQSLITAARDQIEHVTWRQLLTATWDYSCDAWPADGVFVLPKAPLQSVTSISYTNTANVTAVVPSTDYLVDTASLRGRVLPAYGKSWPSAGLRPANGITVRFIAGYGAALAVPAELKAALKLLVGHLYENREAVNVGNIVTPLPLALEWLLSGRSARVFV